MLPTEIAIRKVLERFPDPETGRSIAQLEQIHRLELGDGHLAVTLGLTTWSGPLWEETRAELAQRLNITETNVVEVEAAEKQPYRSGGFRIFDISDRTSPKLIQHQLTGGGGVHRFDMDERYAYISTEMDGFLGAMLVTYDMRDPQRPQEVSRWWLPGQHIAAGEKPNWSGKRHRLHHALRFGNEMFASCWHGGFRIVDVADLSKPKTVASYNYHPPTT